MNTPLHESLNSPVPFELDEKTSNPYHRHYLFKIENQIYRLNISRTTAPNKGSWIAELRSMSPSGKTQGQFKYIGSHGRMVMSTVIAIFHEWLDQYGKIFTSLIIRLPDKVKEREIAFARRFVRRLRINYIEELGIKGIEGAKHKYLFYKSKRHPEDEILKSLMVQQVLAGYDFGDAFAAELLDDVITKTAVSKTNILKNLEIMGHGHDEEVIGASLFKAFNKAEVAFVEKDEDAIQLMEPKVEKQNPDRANLVPKTNRFEHWWNMPLAQKTRILVLDEFLRQYMAASGDDLLKSFIRFLIDEGEGVNEAVEYDTSVILTSMKAVFGKQFPEWKKAVAELGDVDDQRNVEFVRNAFLYAGQDYIKSMDFYSKHFTTYQHKHPYGFWTSKLLGTNKSKSVEAHKLELETTNLNVKFFMSLLNSAKRGMVGRVRAGGTSIDIFPAIVDDVTILRMMDAFLRGNRDNVEATISDADYYAESAIVGKGAKMIAQEGVDVLKWVDLGQIEEPKPINSIYNYSDELFKQMRGIQIEKNKMAGSKSGSTPPTIMSYTGSGYSEINRAFRDIPEGTNAMKNYAHTLLKFIDEFEKFGTQLSFDIEVSRKSGMPVHMELNKTYIEPGGLSTSLNSSVWSGNTKMRIQVPKGSRVYMALGNLSNHSGEKEIILPPGAVLKPYQETQLKKSHQKWYKCLYMGSLMPYYKKRIQALIDQEGNEALFTEGWAALVNELTTPTYLTEENEGEMMNKLTTKFAGDVEEYDREDAIINDDHIFEQSDALAERIKSGEITDIEWTFNLKPESE